MWLLRQPFFEKAWVNSISSSSVEEDALAEVIEKFILNSQRY